jgi:predicted DNA-binding antitoxin AbrB/MazE fold protein
MQTVNAIYDGTTFKPMQPIPVKEEYKVIITFIEPVSKEKVSASKTAKLPRSTSIGFLKGKVKMSADFDEPLDEMKEYM